VATSPSWLIRALSMRAQYETDGWTKDLDPDQSASTVILETMLDIVKRGYAQI
jgi:hypothetical protein